MRDARAYLTVGAGEEAFARTRGLSAAAAAVRLIFLGTVRLRAVEPAVRARVQAHVDQAVAMDRPIRLVNLVGGYKGRRVRSAPHADWSEVFTLRFLCRWLAGVAAIYPPGVVLEYSASAEVASYIDNYRRADIQTYEKEFRALINLFEERTPANLHIRSVTIGDFYDPARLSELIESFAAGPRTADEADWIARAVDHVRRNYVIDGEEDLSALDPAAREARFERAALQACRWYAYDLKHRIAAYDDTILLSHGKGVPGAYEVRSIEGTDKCFWLTEGALVSVGGGEERNDERPVMLMPGDPRLSAAIDRPVRNDLSGISPRLGQIPVIQAPG